MILALPSDEFQAIAQGRRTGLLVSESDNLRFAAGDRLRIEALPSNSGTSDAVTVVVTDVWRREGHDAFLTVHRLGDLTAIPTPGGTLRVAAHPDMMDDYPGFALFINDQLAAVVEWHVGEQSFALRTYNDHDDEPQHFHRWDGSPLEL